jgi:hypothetical protein
VLKTASSCFIDSNVLINGCEGLTSLSRYARTIATYMHFWYQSPVFPGVPTNLDLSIANHPRTVLEDALFGKSPRKKSHDVVESIMCFLPCQFWYWRLFPHKQSQTLSLPIQVRLVCTASNPANLPRSLPKAVVQTHPMPQSKRYTVLVAVDRILR